MSLGDILILAVLFLWLLLSFRYMRKRRKSGKCIGCSGDCNACHGGCSPVTRIRRQAGGRNKTAAKPEDRT